MTSLRAATARLFERLEDDEVDADASFAVAPDSLAAAAEVLTAAADAGLTVRFWGGGSHQSIGNAVAADIAMTSRRLDRIVDWQAEDLTVVVQPGVTVADLEATIAERGQTAVLPELPGNATVGGVVACGLSGYRRLRYGPTRDRVLEVELATGYGAVVRGGGRVVKNVTGYDLPRLATGSLGTLGFIGSVCLKLWPMEAATATVTGVGPEWRDVFRPLALLETDGVMTVYLSGTPEQVDAQVAALDGVASEGLHWPAPLEAAVRLSLRVPPAHVGAAVVQVATWEDTSYRAAHRVGEIEIGTTIDGDRLAALRSWAEAHRGALVVVDAPDELPAEFDPWGTPPPSLEIQRRLKAAFDPAGVCNPGRLPGGL
jgi:glycolate oxidase FAD binding subunit